MGAQGDQYVSVDVRVSAFNYISGMEWILNEMVI